jgi:hypothetical protein
MPKGNIFADLEALRLAPEDATGAAREVVMHVPVRKPAKHEFFRVNPDPAMSLTTSIFTDREERETFLVAPDLRGALLGEMRPALLLPTTTRQGVMMIWPVPLPMAGERRNAWSETAREAAEHAKATWTRMSSDMSLGGYRVYAAEGEIPEPQWPAKSLEELLAVAFRDRVIDIEDHPIVRRLRGLA